jgi:hypothetical protein
MRTPSPDRRCSRFAIGTLLLATAACGSLGRGSGQPASAIIFANESQEQATVYIVAPGAEFRRIGTVFANRTDTLTVPPDLASRGATLNIVARLLARPEVPQTGPISIRPGEMYQVRLGSDAKVLSFLPAGE